MGQSRSSIRLFIMDITRCRFRGFLDTWVKVWYGRCSNRRLYAYSSRCPRRVGVFNDDWYVTKERKSEYGEVGPCVLGISKRRPQTTSFFPLSSFPLPSFILHTHPTNNLTSIHSHSHPTHCDTTSPIRTLLTCCQGR